MQEMPKKIVVQRTTRLHTKEAAQLFYGRDEDDHEKIIGLVAFAKKMQIIDAAAVQDDPYADYFLIEIEKRIKECDRKLDDYLSELGGRYAIDDINYKSEKTLDLTTQFSSPAANLALSLLQKSDKLFLLIIALTHIAVLTIQDKFKMMREVKRLIRSTFLSFRGYRYLGITRKDVELMTVRGIQAKELMQVELSQEILNRTNRANVAKPIRTARDDSMFKMTTNKKGKNE